MRRRKKLKEFLHVEFVRYSVEVPIAYSTIPATIFITYSALVCVGCICVNILVIYPRYKWAILNNASYTELFNI